MSSFCTFCLEGPPQVTLKQCAKCSTTLYCSKECQKADWKVHKKQCGKLCRYTDKGPTTFSAQPPFVATALSPPKGLDQPIAKPFTRLNNGTWLHDRPEADVYRLLIDAYWLRVEDNYTLDGKIDKDSLYGGHPNGLLGFHRFLCLAATSPGLLPPWWNSHKKRHCKRFGMNVCNWSNLQHHVTNRDIIEHYGDHCFPVQLRLLAEVVYRRGPGGSDGTIVREMMVAKEEGNNGLYEYFMTIDMMGSFLLLCKDIFLLLSERRN